MAKVRAPLFSFAASGALAESIVFFPWKGLIAVRKYVIPANPNTALQDAQRTILEQSVDEWHLTKYTASDKSAWDRYAGILAKPMSGFNAFVQMWIAVRRTPIAIPDPVYASGIFSGGAGLFDASADEDGEAVNVWLHWGYSKTALVNTVQLIEAPANTWTKAAIAATVGKYVYARFETHSAAGVAGWSGIYQLIIV